jgi:hypothetical protein
MANRSRLTPPGMPTRRTIPYEPWSSGRIGDNISVTIGYRRLSWPGDGQSLARAKALGRAKSFRQSYTFS